MTPVTDSTPVSFSLACASHQAKLVSGFLCEQLGPSVPHRMGIWAGLWAILVGKLIGTSVGNMLDALLKTALGCYCTRDHPKVMSISPISWYWPPMPVTACYMLIISWPLVFL